MINRKESDILDMSQGEPGYGFAPSVRSRQFFAFLLMIDTYLNNNRTNAHFGAESEESFGDVEEKIKEIAYTEYSKETAARLLKDYEEFISKIEEITKKQGHPKSRFDILFETFRYSTISGGRYPNSWGEMIVRMVVADERSKEFGFDVSFEDIMIINGASHGVGMFFKGLGEEGIKFLTKGDTIMMISPTYAPYTQFVEDRELNLINVSVDPESGMLDEESFEKAKNCNERIKAIVIIDPNNPSGFPFSEDVLNKIADIAEENNAVILTDEVYNQFFKEKKSIVSIDRARKRTICINALSKIERGTGVRFGDLYLAPEARSFIAEKILEPDCPGFIEKYQDARWFLFLTKSVGGSTIGVFQHISGVPGPSQFLGLCHILLGRKEREEYVQQIAEKVQAFYKTLGIPHKGNEYYGIVDLRKIEGPETAKKPIEQILTEIAEIGGVILMPANKFFSEEDRAKEDRTRFVRASIPNLSLENTIKAAEIIREHVKK